MPIKGFLCCDFSGNKHCGRMASLQSLKCSWPLALILASLLVTVSVVHLFLTPIFPSSLDYFGSRRAQSLGRSSASSSSSGGSHGEAESLDMDIDFDARFPSDFHGAVAYRGAPWKSEIGRWLSGCDSVTKEVVIVEIIGGKSCKYDCNGRGVCNRDTGQCRCFHGYSGEGCSVKLQLECNLPSSSEIPYGPWMVSTCPAYCDKTMAMCFCGEGTKYPSRPVAEACGFRMNLPTEPGGPKIPDWSKDDLESVYTTNRSRPGWCNVDPGEAYANKVKFKEECDCKYDGLWGRFCETPSECSCVNQCSGHGYCRGGACQCDNGWHGIDCSIPSILSSIREWPLWLRPSTVEVPDKSTDDKFTSIKASVKKKRPLIYVYDLPPDFNSNLLEGRHFKFECVNRIYSDKNRTLWTTQLYGSQMALYESILASPHRTLNGDEADYFFVPVLDSCIITRADDVPYLSLREHMGLRSSLALDFYKKAYEYIVHHYPYWNITSGRDHIWFFAWDEGACYAPKEIWNSMMLVHWGNTNTKHNHSTTAYWGDIWDGIPSHKRGTHPCFDPKKDLVLPAWKKPEPGAIWLKLWARPRNKRTTLFYFNGNLGPDYKDGRPEDTYSMGIRQKLAAEFGSTPNKKGKLGKQYNLNVTVTPLRTSNYFEELASSIFCGVLPGDGWSGRMEDSIHQGCVPVIIQDGIFLPYENILNYRSFAVRITEDEIPNLVKILQGINETEVDLMLANVQQIWQRFLYIDSILLEAQRQRRLFPNDEDWAVEFSKLSEDDVFTTFIQILHYKLHNDPWRRQLNQRKEFGLPKACLQRSSGSKANGM